MARSFHGHDSARGDGESGQRDILLQGVREPDLPLYSVPGRSGSSLEVGRRGFIRTLLGAGVGLWVPEKTYFFFGKTQHDSPLYDILDDIALYMHGHSNPIYPLSRSLSSLVSERAETHIVFFDV